MYRYNYRSANTSRAGDVPRSASPPIGSLLQTLSTTNVHNASHNDQDTEPVEISCCEYIASYNWLDRGTPTIAIPGIVT